MVVQQQPMGMQQQQTYVMPMQQQQPVYYQPQPQMQMPMQMQPQPMQQMAPVQMQQVATFPSFFHFSPQLGVCLTQPGTQGYGYNPNAAPPGEAEAPPAYTAPEGNTTNS